MKPKSFASRLVEKWMLQSRRNRRTARSVPRIAIAIERRHPGGFDWFYSRVGPGLKVPNIEDRDAAVGILGTVGYYEDIHYFRCFETLARLVPIEKNSLVLKSIGISLGSLSVPEFVGRLSRLAGHSRAKVRQTVAIALFRHDSPVAVKCLKKLSRDKNSEVREWASFRLKAQVHARS